MKRYKLFSKENSRAVFGIFVALLLTFSIYFFREYLLPFKDLGYLGLFVTSLLTNTTVFIPIPYIPVVIVSASILNPILVALVVGLGSAVGELTGYLAGSSGRVIVRKNPKFKKMESYMDKYGLWTIFFLSVVPNFLIDVAGIISGATKIPVYKFLLVAWAGKFVRYVLISYVGVFGFGLT